MALGLLLACRERPVPEAHCRRGPIDPGAFRLFMSMPSCKEDIVRHLQMRDPEAERR